MKKQGRTKFQTTKQFSSDPHDSALNFLWAFFGENAMSAIDHFARECNAVRPIMERLQVLRSKAPEEAEKLRLGVDVTIEKAGRFLISADVKSLQAYLNARIALEAQGQKPVDRTRVQLIQSHQFLKQKLRRSPTVAELRKAAAKIVESLEAMDESQFRRTIDKLGLDVTSQKALNKLRTMYEKTKTKGGNNPSRSEFFSAANKPGLYAHGMSLDEFMEICMADGMQFSDT